MSASKSQAKREVEPAANSHSVLGMVLPTIQQVAVKNVLKRPKSKGKSGNKSASIGRSSKENSSNAFRMRKVYINGKVSANGTPINVIRADSALEPTTHNLLVDRREMKVQLAPLKKKNKKNRERSTSVKSPRILKGMSLNHSAIAGQ